MREKIEALRDEYIKKNLVMRRTNLKCTEQRDKILTSVVANMSKEFAKRLNEILKEEGEG